MSDAFSTSDGHKEEILEWYHKQEDIYWVDFLREDIRDEDDVLVELAPKIYEFAFDHVALKTKVLHALEEYNDQNGVKSMHLVLFKDALQHMMRISRITGRPKGSALLVGVGGSGRQ
jgi:dynein heavy chain